jgi:protein-export membrane protein SecD
MKTKSSFIWYFIAFLASIIVILFVAIEPTAMGWSKYSLALDGRKSFKKGMDVAGWVRLNYKIDLAKYKATYTNPQEYLQITNNVKDIILKNIDNRISQLWVSDYESYNQKIGEDEFLVIEIWWVADLDEAKAIIWKTVELEFKVPYEGDGSEVKQERQLLAEDVLKQAVASPDSMQSLWTTYQEDQIFFSRYESKTKDELPEIYSSNSGLLASRELWSVYPTLAEGVHSVIPPMSGVTTTETIVKGRTISRVVATGVLTGTNLSGENAGEAIPTYTIEELVVTDKPWWVLAKDPTTNEILNGAYFKYASVGQSQLWQPVASITFDEKWKEIFCNLTELIVGKQMAIFVWGNMVTAPVIREKICGGSAQIDGDFTAESAKKLVQDLNEWALPAALILSNEEKVSAKLGESALQWALYAWITGLFLVFAYMFFFYSLRNALIAVATLIFFLTLLFAFVKLIWYAISLSGLAAILLSIGMWVDANILIYERIKEEKNKGAHALEAIKLWYARSRSAIRDGNVTTLLIAVLLLFVWTNVFKWFGTMMIVTILFTLFLMVPFIQVLLVLTAKWHQHKK